MTSFNIDVNGRSRSVTIERLRPGRFRVVVDGHAEFVDAERIGDFGVSLLFPEAGHESGAVQLAPTASPGERLAVWRGATVPVVSNGRRGGFGSGGAGGRPHGEQKVAAPMPGRIVRVLVAEGDLVEARQPVVVIEAMKMENELRSPVAGRVREVSATTGASVEAGRVLVVIE
ncbi:MAG TPA: biotin/lipoyl-containing protein [Vicinamibacterales bacterium]|jgi:biotin carboxyl carrier protein|nr:biotin/lipoyl-containing protein [Vicinamibacterales bacterium]